MSRRRIDTFETVSDETTRPHLYLSRFEGELQLDDPPPLALYDEAMWAELREAQDRLREVERRVSAASMPEPLDHIEVSLGQELWDMLNIRHRMDHDRWAEIERELVAHAATVEKKP